MNTLTLAYQSESLNCFNDKTYVVAIGAVPSARESLQPLSILWRFIFGHIHLHGQ